MTSRLPTGNSARARSSLPHIRSVPGTGGSESPVCLCGDLRNSLAIRVVKPGLRGVGFRIPAPTRPTHQPAGGKLVLQRRGGGETQPARLAAFPHPSARKAGPRISPKWKEPRPPHGPAHLGWSARGDWQGLGGRLGRWAEGAGPGVWTKKPGREKALPGWPDSGFLLRPREKPEQLWSSRDCQSRH